MVISTGAGPPASEGVEGREWTGGAGLTGNAGGGLGMFYVNIVWCTQDLCSHTFQHENHTPTTLQEI